MTPTTYCRRRPLVSSIYGSSPCPGRSAKASGNLEPLTEPMLCDLERQGRIVRAATGWRRAEPSERGEPQRIVPSCRDEKKRNDRLRLSSVTSSPTSSTGTTSLPGREPNRRGEREATHKPGPSAPFCTGLSAMLCGALPRSQRHADRCHRTETLAPDLPPLQRGLIVSEVSAR